MGLIMNLHEAAATLTLGVDMARNDRRRVSSQLRVLTSVAVVGSAAVDDAAVDVFIEDFYVGRFFNTHAGIIQVDTQADVVAVGPHAIPSGSSVVVQVADAPATNPLNVQLA